MNFYFKLALDCFKIYSENELQEIYNKLGALNTALEIAEKI
jgi:hypothetical protein